MGTGHVIKNSLISPQQNSIPSKLASYTILSFTKSNENWRARFQLVRKNSRYECSLFQYAFAWLLFKEPLQATRDREKVLGVLSLKSIKTGRFDILHVHASNRLRCKRIQRYSCNSDLTDSITTVYYNQNNWTRMECMDIRDVIIATDIPVRSAFRRV